MMRYHGAREWSMASVKFAGLCFCFAILLLSCASAPVKSAPQSAPQPAQTAHTVTSERTRTAETKNEDAAPQNIDSVLRVGIEYLSGRIPANSKVAVVSAISPAENLSNYIIDTAAMHLVNKDKFTVIERAEIAALQKEQMYQASGEVRDETAVSIGRQLGVEVIITSAIMETGEKYSLRLKALDVESARILGTRIYHVKSDQTLAALLKPPVPKELPSQGAKTPAKAEAAQEGASKSVKPPVKTETPKEPAKQTVIQGDVNITTNNTTTINGDVYVNTPDWFNPDEWF